MWLTSYWRSLQVTAFLKKAHDCELKRWLELDAFGALPFAGWLYVSTIMQPAKCFVDYYCSEPQSIMSRWRSHWLTSSPSNHFDHHQDHETGVGGGAATTNGATATKATTIPLLCFRLQYRVNSLSRFRKSNNTQLGSIGGRGGIYSFSWQNVGYSVTSVIMLTLHKKVVLDDSWHVTLLVVFYGRWQKREKSFLKTY